MIRAQIQITGPLVINIELTEIGDRDATAGSAAQDEPNETSDESAAQDEPNETSDESAAQDEPNETSDRAAFSAALLRERRIAAGLSVAALRRRSGVAEKTIGNIERGRHTPTPMTLRRLCAVEELKLYPPMFTTVGGRPPKGSNP